MNIRHLIVIFTALLGIIGPARSIELSHDSFAGIVFGEKLLAANLAFNKLGGAMQGCQYIQFHAYPEICNGLMKLVLNNSTLESRLLGRRIQLINLSVENVTQSQLDFSFGF